MASSSLEQKLLTDSPDTLKSVLHDVLHEMEEFIPTKADALQWFSILERRPDASEFVDWIDYQRQLLGIAEDE